MRQPRDSVIRAWLVGLAVALSVASTACGSSAPASAPEPSPNLPSVPEDARSISSASQDALYAEAEQVYRDFFAEHQIVLSQGGSAELPSQFSQYLMQDYRLAASKIYEALREYRLKSKPGTQVRLAKLAPYPYETVDGSLVTIAACSDSSGSPLVGADGTEYPGGINFDVLFLKRDSDQVLKIFDGRDEVVEKCPLG